jgi:hypothetical protein
MRGGEPQTVERSSRRLRRYFRDGRWLLEPAELIDARLDEEDPDGTPVPLAIYDHPYYAKRIGQRRGLTDHMRATRDYSAEQALAEEIAIYEISEPLGAHFDLLVETPPESGGGVTDTPSCQSKGDPYAGTVGHFGTNTGAVGAADCQSASRNAGGLLGPAANSPCASRRKWANAGSVGSGNQDPELLV